MKGARTFGLCLAILGLISGTACRRASRPDSPPPTTAQTRSAASTPVLAGKRLVVLAPGAAEIVDAFGLTANVVGVGDFVDWPPALRKVRKVGGYSAPSEEAILDLRPDLLVTTRSEAAGPRLSRLRSLGIRIVELDTSTLSGVFDSIVAMGRVLSREPEAAAITTAMKSRLEAIETRAKGAPRRRALYVVGREPLYIAGPGSHIDELGRLVGALNVAPESGGTYQLGSVEAMLERRPDVIVDCADNRPDALRGEAAGPFAQWSFLPAVKNRRVFFVDPSRLAIPGTRLPEMAELMGRLIQPEIFGRPSAEDFRPISMPEDGNAAIPSASAAVRP